jgi:Flp pilus assembly protein TadD
MRGGFAKGVGSSLIAVLLMAVPLAGCSSLMPGQSSFGDNKLAAADLPAVNDTTADAALLDARTHFRNNDFGYSAAYYKQAVELAPKSAEGYVGLGASYDRLGRFDQSDRVYATLYAICGPTAQYYNNLGYSFMLRGNLTQALSNFRKAKSLDPKNAVIGNNISMLSAATQA